MKMILLLRIKTCACTGAAVNYTPEQMWNAYEKGQPVHVTLSLDLMNLNQYLIQIMITIHLIMIQTDLLPVPTDAVGY